MQPTFLFRNIQIFKNHLENNMSDLSVGVYSFVSEWKKFDYPLDLWLKYNSEIFDEVALITYGKEEIPYKAKNIIIEEVEPPKKDDFNFYRFGKKKAQDLLNTDWKILLDTDEFIKEIPNLENLNKKLTYILKYRHLYGNLYTEIKGNKEFAYTSPRVHFGKRNIIGDGAVDGPYSIKIVGEFYHTNAVRNPTALSLKWKEQIQREINEKRFRTAKRLKYLEDTFDYSKYKEYWPGSYLIEIDKQKIPKILIENSSRFSWYKFENLPKENSLEDILKTLSYNLSYTHIKYIYSHIKYIINRTFIYMKKSY